MAVDVLTEITIARPVGVVAGYAADPENAPRLRNRGEPRGFSRLAAPMMVRAMRRANEKDLASINAILERA